MGLTQMRQIPLMPFAQLKTVGKIDMQSEAVLAKWWDKANALYEKLSPKQKAYVDERWEAHKGPNHPVYYTYYCRGAASSVPRT